MTLRHTPIRAALLSALLFGAGTLVTGCGRNADAFTPQQLQQQYGITDAYAGQVTTPDGAIAGTLVPVTLPDGRRAQLIIPAQGNQPHTVYYQDDQGLHPVGLQSNVTRQQLVDTPAPQVVEHRAEPTHRRHRSWEKELVIIGGSAGAGATVGALTGGKKGAGIGAAAGGVGGLIYDLATRNK
jgi:hypothetical protein